MIIKIIKSLFNRNKKLYIVLNNNSGASKAKLARACATIGMFNSNMLLSSAIVVRGDGGYLDYLYVFKNKKEWCDSPIKVNVGKYKFSGEHIDAGFTQVKPGTSLAFGIIVKKDKKLDLKLW